jgi:hypothetical protein
MACESITDYLVRESGRYVPDMIRDRTFARSPWMSLIQRGTFPSGMGVVLSNLTYERQAPTEAEPTWSDMSVTDGAEGGSCLPPVTTIGAGSTTRTFSLKRRALHGPRFCAEDLRYSFELSRQLDRIIDHLSDYVTIEWEIRDRHEYFRNVAHKVVITDECPPTSTSTEGLTTYPAECPGAKLSLGILDRWKMRLFREGANRSALGYENGAPILTVIVSSETFQGLLKDNAERRQDLRWGAPNRLLAPFGVQGSLWGYYFIEDPYPRRFTCTGGTYTEVPAFSSTTASKGTRAQVNPDWESAPYEESFIFDPTVFTQLVPEPIVAPHPRVRFDPVNYTGQWSVRNILDEVCNPDGNILFHRAIMAAASEPVHPERGVAFVHLRCDPACELVTTCAT